MRTFYKTSFALAIAGLAVAAVGVTHAASQSNTMTNTVSFTATCDISAIGVDFGVNSLPLLVDDTTFAPNTAVGTAANAALPGGSGNSARGVDGTADDDLTIAGAAVPQADAGVKVACSSAPASVTIVSGTAGGLASATLPTATGAAVAYSSKMGGLSTPAQATQVNYSFSLTPTVTNLSPASYLAVYAVSAATIPASTNSSLEAGHYSDVITATVNF